jgi:hypothetical protein
VKDDDRSSAIKEKFARKAEAADAVLKNARAAPFVCPRCGAASYHPKDEEHGYCGRCHQFVGEEK